MKYAVIVSGGKQYKVSEGQELFVDLLPVAPGSTYRFDNVLLIRDGDLVTLGTPHVSRAEVVATVQSHLKGEKIRVAKFKAKVRFKRTMGFRPMYTKLSIDKISVSAKSAPKKKRS